MGHNIMYGPCGGLSLFQENGGVIIFFKGATGHVIYKTYISETYHKSQPDFSALG
jgi:hypothetical protein